jgi:hypothetical protein
LFRQPHFGQRYGSQPKRVIFITGRGANNVEPKVNIVV